MQLDRLLVVALLVAVVSAARAEAPQPQVVRVHPSGADVPENLLRISVKISDAVGGPLLPRLSLVRANGQPVEDPFLHQELWSPNGTVLTVLLHPGRVKSGLYAHDKFGPILLAGEEITMALDGKAIKHWRVTGADRRGPEPAAWQLSKVHSGSRQVLVVKLDDPIDALAANYLAIKDVEGRKVEGRARLMNDERSWTFEPSKPWRKGGYELVVRGTLEDPAGNRLGRRFESSGHLPTDRPQDGVIVFSTVSGNQDHGRPPLSGNR